MGTGKSLNSFFWKKAIDKVKVVQDSQKKISNASKGEACEEKEAESYPHIKIAKNKHF